MLLAALFPTGCKFWTPTIAFSIILCYPPPPHFLVYPCQYKMLISYKSCLWLTLFFSVAAGLLANYTCSIILRNAPLSLFSLLLTHTLSLSRARTHTHTLSLNIWCQWSEFFYHKMLLVALFSNGCIFSNYGNHALLFCVNPPFSLHPPPTTISLPLSLIVAQFFLHRLYVFIIKCC